jgi:2-succinyl-5-enolpyruvyl-6-hydroxy-3-cyclohexene-1-carboxylate synthase
LNKLTINEQGFPKQLKEPNKVLTQKHREYVAKTEWSDFRLIHGVLHEIPGDSVIHLANSSPVRYSQLSASKTDCCYFSNRGTSGIDGCISTALGSAYLAQKKVYVISGDLAFIYDSNALWNKYTHLNLKIVVLNNNGGNIFSLIDSGKEMENAREYFETPHAVNIRSLAQAYGVAYLECTSFAALPETMATLSQTEVTCILEIKTDAKVNTRTFKEYYQYIKHA